MQIKTFIVVALLFFATNVSFAETIHNAASYPDRIVNFVYVSDDLYKIFVTLDRVTEIRLQPGENFVTMYGGSTDGLMVERSMTRQDNSSIQTSLFIKPTMNKVDTNVVIITDLRMYRLVIESAEVYYNPLVSWRYPLDEHYATQKAIARLEQEFSIIPIFDAANRTFLNYEFIYDEGKRPIWKPVYVFETGGKIYIRMPEDVKLNVMPVIFAIEKGKPQLVNFRIRQNHFIVDRLSTELLMVNGDEQLLIRKAAIKEAPSAKEKKKRKKAKNE